MWQYMQTYTAVSGKPGFHYPSWRPELTAQVDGWPVSITRQHEPCWVVENGLNIQKWSLDVKILPMGRKPRGQHFNR